MMWLAFSKTTTKIFIKFTCSTRNAEFFFLLATRVLWFMPSDNELNRISYLARSLKPKTRPPPEKTRESVGGRTLYCVLSFARSFRHILGCYQSHSFLSHPNHPAPCREWERGGEGWAESWDLFRSLNHNNSRCLFEKLFLPASASWLWCDVCCWCGVARHEK